MTQNLGHPIPFHPGRAHDWSSVRASSPKPCPPPALSICPEKHRAGTNLKAEVVMNHYFEGKVNVRRSVSLESSRKPRWKMPKTVIEKEQEPAIKRWVKQWNYTRLRDERGVCWFITWLDKSLPNVCEITDITGNKGTQMKSWFSRSDNLEFYLISASDTPLSPW